MLVTSFGHGTTSAIVAGMHVMIDPVLTDTFMEGLAAPRPRRTIDLDAVPDIDAVVITHFHVGHFDPETLNLLPRDTAIFHPDDSLIVSVLAEMGFTNARAVSPGQSIAFGDGEIIFTGNGPIRPLVGVLLRDSQGVAWYMADRGDLLPPDEIEKLVEQVGGIDVLIPSHPSDLHSFFRHSTWDGGGRDGEDYAAWLRRCVETVLRVKPKLFVPASTNFAYVGRAAWLNRYMFPMAPEEFVSVVRSVAPELDGVVLAPGDAVDLVDRNPFVLRGAADFVSPQAGGDDRGLDPTVPPPCVADGNPDGHPKEELEERLEQYLVTQLVPWLDAPTGGYGSLLRTYRNLAVNYRLSAVFSDGTTTGWRISLTDEDIKIARVAQDEPPGYQELHTRIAASVLDRWIRNEMPYYLANVDCRRTGSVTGLGRTAQTVVTTTSVEATCLVTAHLTAGRERLQNFLVQQAAHLRQTEQLG
ncbi:MULTISPECIES: MBL fold metallo-hydrolase [unclassified Streptomyces]|uniref:MBL fold metallo-hydrolase n=1 Tax=unclassified Streptomyces TaxID=2593676 RepID=UPI00380836A7